MRREGSPRRKPEQKQEQQSEQKPEEQKDGGSQEVKQETVKQEEEKKEEKRGTPEESPETTTEQVIEEPEYLEKGLDEDEITVWIQAYAYILLPEEERSKPENNKLKESFDTMIGMRETQYRDLNFLGLKIRGDSVIEPGEFAKDFIDYFDDIAEGGTESILIKSTTFERFPEIIKSSPEKFGIQKLESGDYEIHITKKQILEVLKKFVESQKETAASQEAWRKMEEKIYKAKGLKERFRTAFIKNIGPGEETAEEITKTIEAMIKFAEQIMEKTAKSGLSEEERKIVEEIINKVDEAVEIRGEAKPEWQKKLYEWAEKAPKEISKKLLEGGKNLASLLGTGFLLWGAVFAFYLPVLIADYAQKKAGDFMK